LERHRRLLVRLGPDARDGSGHGQGRRGDDHDHDEPHPERRLLVLPPAHGRRRRQLVRPGAPRPVRIDGTAPSAPAVTAPRFTKAASVAASWTATDGGSGVASYDVRYRAASANGDFGDYVGWLLRAGASGSLTGTPGTTYCLSARSWDTAGNVSGW